MYGENLPSFQKKKVFKNLKFSPALLNKLLVVVGGEKVPSKVFKYSNWNIAISNQPHSEVGALAVFLNTLLSNSLEIEFSNPSRQILPSIKGKKSYSGSQNEEE